jgi:ceramide glucosyltransferase
MVILLLVLAALGAAGLLVTLLADRAVHRTLAVAPPAPGRRPPISVLKPLKGVDEGLYENLASIAAQHRGYPRLEILFGVEDATDPAVPVARAVAAAFPAVPVQVVVCGAGGRAAALNPKVRILEVLAARARHEHVLVSDSNVRAPAGYLAGMADQLAAARDVGLVTSVVVGEGEASTGALLENLHLATYVARASLFARHYLRHSCVIGKSMLFRQSDLAALGGWAMVRDLLAEDYYIGRAFELGGRRVVVGPQPVVVRHVASTTGRFVSRHLRWGQMRRRISPLGYLLETLFNPTPFLLALAALAGLLAVAAGSPAEAALAVAAVAGVGARLAADRALLARLRRRPLPWRKLAWSVPKDLLALALWPVAAFRRTIDWRGNLLIVGPGTRLRRPGQEERVAPAPRGILGGCLASWWTRWAGIMPPGRWSQVARRRPWRGPT